MNNDFAFLRNFCQSDCDRYQVLKKYISSSGLPHSTILTEDCRHIRICYPANRYQRGYYRKVLIAHYDRSAGSPGANDNAAAVVQLLRYARLLNRIGRDHNTDIIFTDREELESGEGPDRQGTWLLARRLRQEQQDDCIFFVFDQCGIGNRLISPCYRPLLLEDIQTVRNALCTIFPNLLTIDDTTALFSDDLGLLHWGYTSLRFSTIYRSEEPFVSSGIIPPSWRSRHTAADTIEHLEQHSFRLIFSFLRGLLGVNFRTARNGEKSPFNCRKQHIA